MESMTMPWLSYPLQLHSSRVFECEDLPADECNWYKQRWHFWYIADYVFALPTVAFFMSAIGIFIIGHFLSTLFLTPRNTRTRSLLQKPIAVVRFLSYRGFHIKSLQWNSAPVGVLLLGLAGAVFFFCMDLAPQPYYWADAKFGGSPPLATRSGWLALGCMPFLFATASKTNWITLLTGVSHERLQVFHRWTAYAFFVLALLHTFPFIVYHIRWHDMEEHFSSSLIFYWTGIVALVFQAWLTFASHSTIRNLGYEFFKITHLFAVVIFMITFFWHCDYTLTSWDYFIATAAVYVPCFVYPWLRTAFEYGFKQKATVNIEDNDFIKVVIPAKFTWKPGQHCFLRFTGFGIFQAISGHPFTICSSPSTGKNAESELVFYIRRAGGFTARLYEYAREHPNTSVNVLVDGPYGGINVQKYYEGDHLLVIAGGSGAGWCLPFVERFISDTSAVSSHVEEEKLGKAETQTAGTTWKRPVPLSLRIVLATRDISSRVWFLQRMSELLSKASATTSKSNINVQVYLTGDAAQKLDLPKEVLKDEVGSIQPGSSSHQSSAEGVEISAKHDEHQHQHHHQHQHQHNTSVLGNELEGRPRLPQIVQEEAARTRQEGGSLGVFVCGPTTMLNDVRNAVARENLGILKGGGGGVYLHSEHFSWA